MRTMPVDEAIDLVRAAVGTDQTTRTDPEVAIDSIAAELDAARAEIERLRVELRLALGYLDQHPGEGQRIAARLRALDAVPTGKD